MEKRNGEIVDYYNVFRSMKRALKDYAQGGDDTEPPVKEKTELFRLLDDAIEQGLAFCHEKQVALREVLGNGDVFKMCIRDRFTDHRAEPSVHRCEPGLRGLSQS